MERPVTALRGCGSPAGPSRPGSSGLDAAALKTSRSWQAIVPSEARATRPTRRASMRRLLEVGDGRCHVLGRAVAGCVRNWAADTDHLHRHGRAADRAAGDRRPGRPRGGQGARPVLEPRCRLQEPQDRWTSSTTPRIPRRRCRTSSVSSPIRSTSPSSAPATRPQRWHRRRSPPRRGSRSCRCRLRRRSSPRRVRTSTWRCRLLGSTPTAWRST